MSTNVVEGFHSVRRKFAEKRLNFGKTYELRANFAILSMFLENWEQLILEMLDIHTSDNFAIFQKVFNVVF
ncbi:MAG: hypothetical protein ACYCUI_15685 [Vulcanimicrobiaceae bacterium]